MIVQDPTIPIRQSDQGVVTPADDAQLSGHNKAPKDSLNPYLIPDGFSYNVHLKNLPYRSFPMQLRLLDKYRREALQGLWQPRWYGVPQDPSIPIAAGDSLQYQIRLARGSILWGMSFAVIAPGLTSDIRVSAVDQCTNHILITEFETASAFRANFTSGTPSSGFNCVLMYAPYQVSGDTPYLLVTLANTDINNSKQCQLLLMFLEPAGSPG